MKMVNSVELGPLPTGWDVKYDPRTRRNYFINYINKTTTWEDPRQRQVHVHHVPPHFHDAGEVQPPVLHGTSDFRQVYPSYPSQFQPQHAFQMPNPYMQELQRQELSTSRVSPVPLRAHTAPIMGSHAIGHSTAVRVQETSFTNSQVTDEAAAKIGALFPTVSDTHIRTLLLKYHNREAVVISALQVEKNPITTPGPYTPPTQRHILPPASSSASVLPCTPSASVYSRTTITQTGGVTITGTGTGTGTGTVYTSSPASSTYLGSPAFRHTPRPHSSPKMKLRYMKSLFPKADETVILDALLSADDNLRGATDLLLSKGYEKRENTVSSKGTPQRKVEKKEKEPAPAPPRLRGAEEKQKMRERLCKKYNDLADHLISMALDSADYDEDRAAQILNMTKDGSRVPSGSSSKTTSSKSDSEKASTSTPVAVVTSVSNAGNSPGDVLDSPSSARTATTADICAVANDTSVASPSPRPDPPATPTTPATSATSSASAASADEKKNEKAGVSFARTEVMLSKRTKGKKEVPMISRGTSTTEDKEFKSPYLTKSSGADPNRHRGPNDDLLLENYVSWTGPDPSLYKGRRQPAFGSMASRIVQSKYTAMGPNPELRKGPKCGLAKGSIYSHLTASVIVGGVSCGK